jgi:hypothetical protein
MNRFVIPATILSAVVLISGAAQAMDSLRPDIRKSDKTWSGQPISLASIAAPEPRGSARNRTELALKCWLGLVEYKGCWKSVCDPKGAGPLERVEYLGRTAAGTDIYQVRYRYRATAAYGIVPDPKGKTDQYLVKATDHYWIKREISPRAAPILIYTRPENAPAAGCGVGFSDFN